MITVQVLISCMHENDFSIVNRTNIQGDAIIVNQCDEEKVEKTTMVNKKGNPFNVVMIYTRERGLSRSRNMAIKYATADICLICDDDEFLDDDYVETIQNAYSEYLEADLMTFIVHYKNKKFASKKKKIGVMGICKTFSVQITFKRQSIIKNGIHFDVQMGSGSGNGAGEENKFLMDCYRKGLKMLYIPDYIGKVLSANSQWNKGSTPQYLSDRGWTIRRTFGFLWGYPFLWYNAMHHMKGYSKDGVKPLSILLNMHKGFLRRTNN